MEAAKNAVSKGLIKLPAPGTGAGGQACPTTHDFRIVDQAGSSLILKKHLCNRHILGSIRQRGHNLSSHRQ